MVTTTDKGDQTMTSRYLREVAIAERDAALAALIAATPSTARAEAAAHDAAVVADRYLDAATVERVDQLVALDVTAEVIGELVGILTTAEVIA
jgi:hypothetical protein